MAPARQTEITGHHEERRSTREAPVALATLACPRCDAPVSPGPRPLVPAERLSCPFCAHPALVRDFLSLATPGRPARVVVRARVGAR